MANPWFEDRVFPDQEEKLNQHIDILEKALKEIRDSTYRPAITLRGIAARALEHKRP